MQKVFPALGQAFKRMQEDEYRIPIQTASAVLLAYLVASLVVPEEASWSVFSALFVVQASLGGTIEAVLGRIAGAVVGAAMAVVLTLTLGQLSGGTVLALLVGVVAMSVLTARWPILAYGLVTVSFITVAPDFYVAEGAFVKVVAIAVGSLSGLSAAFAVLPVLARRTEQEHLAMALRSCGKLIVDRTACLVGDKSDKDKDVHRTIARSLERARVLEREARIEEKTPAMGFRPFSESLLPEVERFEYTLAVVDRFSDKPMSEELCAQHKAALLSLAETVNANLIKIADAIDAGTYCEPVDDAWDCYESFAGKVDDAMEDQLLSRQDRQRLVVLKGAYGSVMANLSGLAQEVEARLTQGTKAARAA